MRRTATSLLLMALLGLTGCGESEDPATADATPARTANGCQALDRPQPKGEQQVEEPTERLDPDRTHVATVRTNCGDFDITLAVERAPVTTSSFAHLTRQDFYDGLTFHRISPGFVIQGGDPLGDGRGGPGYSVREAPPGSLTYDKGVVAMAKRGDEPAGTSGSQFFVVTESTDLDPDYALLGRVTRGMDVVERIAASAIDSSEQPEDPVVISDVTIAESES
jgi:peptidyl-prolyl cis-trans isomerase B (cyclophilin B)